MRVLLLHKGATRHKALASFLAKRGMEVISLVESRTKPQTRDTDWPENIASHFASRDQAEKDFFSLIVDLQGREALDNSTVNLTNSINDNSVLELAASLRPEYVVTFGCSLLGKAWLETFPNRIIGIHLGLSPYYRGAGTNFFPFVNGELGAVGATLMRLDAGIDTGDVVHQIRATFSEGDSIHTVGNRLISNVIGSIAPILLSKPDLTEAVPLPAVTGRLYKKSDFDSESLETALRNMREGLVQRHIANLDEENGKFPLVRDLWS